MNQLTHPAFAPLQGEHALMSKREAIETDRNQLQATIGITDKLIGKAREYEYEVRAAATEQLKAKLEDRPASKESKTTTREAAFYHLPRRLRPPQVRQIVLNVDRLGKMVKPPIGISHRTVGAGLTIEASPDGAVTVAPEFKFPEPPDLSGAAHPRGEG